MNGAAALALPELIALFGHFLALSLLAIGGAMATVPDMHRYLVGAQGWMSDTQFSASVALAQAAPGPNLLFVAVLGWKLAGAMGVLATMSGTLIPSTTLAVVASRWARANRATLGLQAFVAGTAPVTVGLVLATGWLLAEPFGRDMPNRFFALALMTVTLAIMLRGKWSPLWLIGAGAVAGALGLV